jgi:hypothetical protein
MLCELIYILIILWCQLFIVLSLYTLNELLYILMISKFNNKNTIKMRGIIKLLTCIRTIIDTVKPVLMMMASTNVLP